MNDKLKDLFKSATNHKECVALMKVATDKGFITEEINSAVSARLKEIRIASRSSEKYNKKYTFVRVNLDVTSKEKSYQSIAVDPGNIGKNLIELYHEKNLVRV